MVAINRSSGSSISHDGSVIETVGNKKENHMWCCHPPRLLLLLPTDLFLWVDCLPYEYQPDNEDDEGCLHHHMTGGFLYDVVIGI